MVSIQSIKKIDDNSKISAQKPTAPNVFAHRIKTNTEDNSYKIVAGLAGLAVVAVAGIMYARKGKVMNEKIRIKPLDAEKETEIIEKIFHKIEIPSSKLDAEKSLSNLAKEKGVSVSEFDDVGFYKTMGVKASPMNNPITSVHIEDVNKNLFIMDSNGIIHNDIDIGTVFYTKGTDNVEFQGFGNGFTFGIKDGKFVSNVEKEKLLFPEFMMPSNQIDYEGNCLGKYLAELDKPEDVNAFIENYLQSSASYHEKRAEYLAKNGFKESSPWMYEGEVVQSSILKKPTKELIDLRLQRIDFKHKQRLAFTEWDEGGGACDYEPSAERRLSSIMGYMDSMESCLSYIDKAHKYISKTKNDKQILYGNRESAFGNYWLNNLQEWVKGMAEYNFNNPKVIQGAEDERKLIATAFDEISNSKFEDKPKAIEKFRELYKELAKKYNFEI